MITISEEPFDPAKVLSAFIKASTGAGAIVNFIGHVRPESSSGPVHNLHLQAYRLMTERGIEMAANEARSRWSLISLRIIHRIGDMSPGDPIVFVATASDHRRAAFEAADFLMDYLKTQAVFWKKETSAKEEKWIEPSPEDYTDSTRWHKHGGLI